MKQSEINRYLDLLTNKHNNHKKISFNKSKRDRYLQPQLQQNIEQQDKQQFAVMPFLANKKLKRHIRDRSNNKLSSSQGQLPKKNNERHNLYQIYCEQIKKRKNQDNKCEKKLKRNRNMSFNDIFDKVNIEDSYKSPHCQPPKTKSLRLNLQNNSKSPPKRVLRSTKNQFQPQELNIGAINALKMPRIQQRTSNNLADFRNSLKLDKLSLNLRKVKANGDRLTHKLEGWQTKYQDQSLAPLYFHF